MTENRDYKRDGCAKEKPVTHGPGGKFTLLPGLGGRSWRDVAMGPFEVRLFPGAGRKLTIVVQDGPPKGMRAYKYGRECAICGQPIVKGQARNREHVISRWALDWTDSLSHVEAVHWDYAKNEAKEMALNSFVLPVHETCNTIWGRQIEEPASVAVKALSAGKALTDDQLLAILVWADKTRAMYELAVNILEKNPMQVTRHLAPMQKIGMTDRILLLYRFPGPTRPYVFMPSLPAFHRTPTSLHIRIGDIGMVIVTDGHLFDNLKGDPFEDHPKITKAPVVDTLNVAQRIDSLIRLDMRGRLDPAEQLKPYGHGRVLVMRGQPPNIWSGSKGPLHPPPKISTKHYMQLNRSWDFTALSFLRVTQAALIERHTAFGEPPDERLVWAHEELKRAHQHLANQIEAFEIPEGDTLVAPNSHIWNGMEIWEPPSEEAVEGTTTDAA